MKIGIIGNLPEEFEKIIPVIDTFVQNNKVGVPVILSAGNVLMLHQIDKYAKGKGYDSVIMGNVLPLTILNSDKVVIIWDGVDKKMENVLATCKREKKSYMEIKTK